jgi:hypothetical protein
MGSLSPARRRIAAILQSRMALLAIAGVVASALVAGILAVRHTGPVIEGTFASAILSGSDAEAQATWKRLRPLEPDLPWQTVAIAKMEWTENGADRLGKDCSRHVFLLHPPNWQMSAESDESFSRGEVSNVISAVASDHPEILENGALDGTQRSIAGTQMSQPVGREANPHNLELLWSTPSGAAPQQLKAGIALTCNDEVEAFAWLDPA